MLILVLCLIALASIPKIDQEPVKPTSRYKHEGKTKSNGVIYTPPEMAYALASEMVSNYSFQAGAVIKILDPAIGEAELPFELIAALRKKWPKAKIRVVGFDIDPDSCDKSAVLLRKTYPFAELDVRNNDFLSAVEELNEKFDFVIANPPYIRTQILGADKVLEIATKLGLNGRIDIYYAFLVATAKVLAPHGVAGYITSNKFFSIKSGAAVRKFMMENYKLYSLVDYGDTKVFENAAVLPCTIVFGLGKTETCENVSFTTIYQTESVDGLPKAASIFQRPSQGGKFTVPDGRAFELKIGTLGKCKPGDVWTCANAASSEWLKRVEQNTWMRLSDLGKIKVGIKTTADNVFIGDNWGDENIELLRPLLTHRDAGKITAGSNCHWRVLYPHTTLHGKRCAVDLDRYPKAKRYLERHRTQLDGRSYIHEAGRRWYEIWVPQNPDSWQHRKIVFRDISDTPQFWYDDTGAIVNGDCYWIDIPETIPDDMVFLALAVTNSKFIERYYDTKFNTKLYSGKRRYMAQFVEQFPLPTTNSVPSQKAISLIRSVIEEDRPISIPEMSEINGWVDEMFDAP